MCQRALSQTRRINEDVSLRPQPRALPLFTSDDNVPCPSMHSLSNLLTGPTPSVHRPGTADAYGEPTPSTSNSSPGLHQLETSGDGESLAASGRKGKGSKKRDTFEASDGEFDEGAPAVGGPEKKVSNTGRSWRDTRPSSRSAPLPVAVWECSERC